MWKYYTKNQSFSTDVLYEALWQNYRQQYSTSKDFTTISKAVYSVTSPPTKLVPVWKPPRKQLRAPIPPVPPLRRVYQEPKLRPRRPNQSTRSWNLAKRKFDIKYQSYLLRKSRAERSYQLAMVRYRTRLSRYEALWAKYISPRKLAWRRQYIKGTLPENPYHYSLEVTFPPVGAILGNYWYGSGNAKWGFETYNIRGYLGDWVPAISWPDASPDRDSLLASVQSLALKRYFDELDGSSVHIANMIAERAQTVDLIKGYLKTLLKLVKNFSLKRIALELESLLSIHKNKKLADETLAFLFGARPLMDDLYGIVEKMSEDSKPETIKVRGSAKKKSVITTVQPVDFGEITFVTTIEVRYSYVTLWHVDSTLTTTLQDLGLINPAEVLWEKLPWSFVIDWVWPIGNWIRSLTSDVGLTFINGTYTEKISETTVASYKGVRSYQDNSTGMYQERSFIATRTLNRKNRVILDKPPALRFPSFKNPISVTHLIESLALFRQLLKR